MKKIILFAFALMASVTLFAQDVIITKDAKKIDAKILEVSKTEIKYKELDNLDGPTFILETQEINTIIYSNGKVTLYNQEEAKQETQQKAAQKAEEDEELKAWIEESDKNKAVQESAQNVIVDFEVEYANTPLWCNFINRSSGATEFRWDFGDGTWGYAKDMACHTYESAGTYTVTLTATVGDKKYVQKKTITVGGNAQQVQANRQEQEQINRLQQQAAESGAQLRKSIQDIVTLENSYAIDITNKTKYPYRINLDGHILGVVNPYKTERFIVSVEIYGRMQAVQTSGYMFSPTIKEFKIPRQQKKTACSVIIK